MSDYGESWEEAIRSDFNRSVVMDFQGAKLLSDTGFLLMRQLGQRRGVLAPIGIALDDHKSVRHTKHSMVETIRQRANLMAAGYEDCNYADFLRVDPALRLSLGKDQKFGAGQSDLSRLENDMVIRR